MHSQEHICAPPTERICAPRESACALPGSHMRYRPDCQTARTLLKPKMISPRNLHPIFRNFGSRWRAQVGKRSAGTDSVKRRGEWESRMFTLSLHSSHQDKDELYQMEYGEARLDSPSSGAAAIMAVHSSGSSYKQWSGLTEYISTGSCSGLYGINLFGYGRSEAWRREMRQSATEDLVALVETATEHVKTATEHVDPRRRWHLIGHSAGGGAVLAAAASGGPLVDKLDAVTVFEPFLLNLFLASNEDEKKGYQDATAYIKAFSDAIKEKNPEKFTKDIFYDFWLEGKWESLPEEVRHTFLQAHVPHVIYLFESLISPIDKGLVEVEKMLNNLAKLKCAKKMVISYKPGEGSAEIFPALASILQREAGFQIVRAPAGGHMGPLTHKHQVLPLLL